MIKTSIKTILRKLGFEITRLPCNQVFDNRFPSNPYDAQVRLLQDSNIKDPIIFDIGAYKGSITELYKSKFPTSRIYCFEPFPESIEILKKKFSNDSSIKIITKAVSDATGTRNFYVNYYDATNSLLPRPSTERRYFPKYAGSKTTIKVDAISIDDFITDWGIDRVDIMKFDIQGGELKALQGASNLLNKSIPSLIYTETMFVPHYENNPLFHELWKFLADFKYSLFDIYDIHRGKNGQIRFGDALFVNQLLREKVINQYPEEP